MIVLIACAGLLLAGRAHGNAGIRAFEDKFVDFLEENGYASGTVGVMKNGELPYAAGFTLDEKSELQGNPLKLWPASSLSKTLTAITIMTLVEDGYLDLEDTVFGSKGLLREFRPFDMDKIQDHRMRNITINHLLHHSAGWDATTGPLYDPMLNTLYVDRGQEVPDIKREMKVTGPLTTYHVIRYVMSRHLDFTPGKKVVYSNFAYSVLGRVIEEVTDTSYEDYVKTRVLEPCGMWHTRIGNRGYNDDFFEMEKDELTGLTYDQITLYKAMNLEVIDSTLGWFSNVVDMLRMMRCIDGTGDFLLLSEKSLQEMVKQPPTSNEDSEAWFGMGLTVDSLGVMYQTNDLHTDDLIMYHTGLQLGATEVDPERPKMCYVVFLEGKNHQTMRFTLNEMVFGVPHWPAEDVFTSDLTDIGYISDGRDVPLVKLKLSEHHIKGYVNAVKQHGYKILFISAYDDNLNTHFVVVSHKDPDHDTSDYVIETGLTSKKLYTYQEWYAERGYPVSFLQGYVSYSHDESYRYLGIFERNVNKPLKDTVFGLRSVIDEYKKVHAEYTGKSYIPAVQSITFKHKEDHVDYLFEKSDMTNFKSYINLDVDELAAVVATNADLGRRMVYLDGTRYHGQPRFSVIFKQGSVDEWKFVHGVHKQGLLDEIMQQKKNGLDPIVVTGYELDEEGLKFVAYFGKR